MKSQSIVTAEQTLAHLLEATRFVLLAKKELESVSHPSLPCHEDFYDVAESIEKLERGVSDAIAGMAGMSDLEVELDAEDHAAAESARMERGESSRA